MANCWESRRGLATKDGKGEAVVGMVLKLIGANTSNVISAVTDELATINANLPEGIEVSPYYDQAQLVEAAVSTVTNALLQGTALLAIVLLAFLGGWRPSLQIGRASRRER